MLVHALLTGLILSALAIDVAAPSGTAAWLVYFVPLWAAARWYRICGGFCVTALCAALLLLGGLPSPPEFLHATDLGQRALGAAALCGTAFSIWSRRPRRMPRREWEANARLLITCQEAERRRLAGLLHDEISQLLAAICMRLHVARDLSRERVRSDLDLCLEIADQAIAQVRELSLDLSPSMLDDFGLLAALRGYLDRLAERTGLSVNLAVSASLGPLPGELETVCFRIIQEALANAVRHASARRVDVELRQDAEALWLTIRDDGVGFDPQAEAPHAGPSRKLGLTATRLRVALLGGCFRVESAPSQGTTVRVGLPLGDGPAEVVACGPERGPDDSGPAVFPGVPSRRRS